jgi:predicted DNA binding CopG/RHH family protein
MSARKKPTTSKRRTLPTFRSEAAERDFWATHDSSEYVNWATARPVRLPALKPSTETISLRLPADLLTELKVQANQRDVPYQSLLKVYLSERVASERQRPRRRARAEA